MQRPGASLGSCMDWKKGMHHNWLKFLYWELTQLKTFLVKLDKVEFFLTKE